MDGHDEVRGMMVRPRGRVDREREQSHLLPISVLLLLAKPLKPTGQGPITIHESQAGHNEA
jgi:hypothetical protein